MLIQNVELSSHQIKGLLVEFILGNGGCWLRYLHGRVDAIISCMHTCSVGSTQCSGCMVYGPGAMATI